MNLKIHDTDDLRDTLEEAQEKLYEAIRLLEIYIRETGDRNAEAYLVDHLKIIRETGDRNAEAYLVDHLKIIAGRGHGFLSSDLNIDDIIEHLDEIQEDEEE